MNALVRKEARLLLPSFVIGLLLAFSMWLLPDDPKLASGWRVMLVVLPFLICPAMLLMMALDSFGREFSGGTFSNLLALPVRRSRIWWTKTLLLAGAVTLLWAAWWFSLAHNKRFQANSAEELRDVFLMTALFVTAVYSGGLWTVLLFRQVAAGFWITLLTPATLAMTVSYFTLDKQTGIAGPAFKPVLVAVFSIYCVGGFLFARWLFLRAQDAHWTGGTIALPEFRGTAGLFRTRSDRRQRRPWAALWAKEFQLHQSQFVLAGAVALLHLAVLATRRFGDFKESPTVQILLEAFWVLWFAMPFLVGCAAVAEERKLGTLEGQLCLPARRRTQFIIKVATALLLSVLLGAVMPVLFEGTRILPKFDPIFAEFQITEPAGPFFPLGESLSLSLPFLSLAALAAFIAAISFYASTLARNTMQALAPALLGFIITWLLCVGASEIEEIFHYPLWRGWLVFFIGVPVMAIALPGLMYWNFKRVLVGWNVWRRNLLVIVASLGLVTTLTAGIYHRAWELVATLEPPHGTARLNSATPIRLRTEGYYLTAQLADGRVWSSRFIPSVPNLSTMLSGSWKLTEISSGNKFLEGTNWASVVHCFQDLIGIQKDGSLWVSEQRVSSWSQVEKARPETNKLVRVGDETDWKSVSANGFQAYLLKTNGTLWLIGTNHLDRNKQWLRLHNFEPRRLGTDSDWVEITTISGRGTTFHKADGTAWVLRKAGTRERNSEIVVADLSFYRAPEFDGQNNLLAATWAFSREQRGEFQVGVLKDGTLRVITGWAMVPGEPRWSLQKRDIQLGHESNWLSVCGNRETVAALKGDGSLWKLNFAANLDAAHASRFSEHSDWVAISDAFGGMISLAADGSLWFWNIDQRHLYSFKHDIPPLLAASRRPQRIGNIFSER